MIKKILIPDIGTFSGVAVIEILVSAGDVISKEDSLITLETDKASMEIPSPFSGILKSMEVKVGDKVSEGTLIATMEVEEESKSSEAKPSETKPEVVKPADAKTTEATLSESKSSAAKIETVKENKETKFSTPATAPQGGIPQQIQVHDSSINATAHAGPAVRRFARELGVNLSTVPGTGLKGRILSSDVKTFVKQRMTQGPGSMQSGAGGDLGFSLPAWPQIDHAKFGEITIEPLSRIKKLSGGFLHRNWVRVPHVTQFDEADITELEQFRKDNQTLAEQQGVKLTPLVFIMKAVVAALKAFPQFNASLDATGSELIIKKYFHLGVAVDTPNGLVVPVVRDVDQKGLFQLAKELGELSQRARKGQLTAQEMQGSSFSISSLGGIGGTAFTPIVNVPDVAILGVSKSQVKPIYLEGEFKPRLMLPLSLSYDHRVVDGAEAARFTSYLVKQLSDIRRLLL